MSFCDSSLPAAFKLVQVFESDQYEPARNGVVVEITYMVFDSSLQAVARRLAFAILRSVGVCIVRFVELVRDALVKGCRASVEVRVMRELR